MLLLFNTTRTRARARAQPPDPQAPGPLSLWTEAWPTHPAILVLDVKYAKWSIKYAEIHVFSGCEQIHSKYTVKYTGGRHVIVTAATS